MTRSVIRLAGVAGVMALSVATARADACEELWRERNAIYKEAGYCFRTARAIAVFGNAGCQYDDARDLPLTRQQKAEIEQLRYHERQMLCAP